MHNVPFGAAANLPETDAILTACFQAILNHTEDMVFVKNADLVYVAASMPFVHMAGKTSLNEIIGRTDFEIFEDPELARRYTSDDHKLLEGRKDLINYPEPLADDHGKHRYASTSKYILTDHSGHVIGIMGVSKDITREHLARQHYQRELEYLFELPSDTYAAVFIDVDDWRIISQRRQLVNNCTLPSCGTVEELLSAAADGFADENSQAALFYRKFSPAVLYDIFKSGKSTLQLKYLRHMCDGSSRWVQNDIKFLTDPDTNHLCVMLCARDIDAETQEELELILAAKTDRMTMLLNRDSTMDHIHQLLAAEGDRCHALFMLDVDNFKSLNDTMGHQAGDEFLISLSRQLRSCFRESDIVGRIGGDEFFVLMRNIDSSTTASKKAQRLLAVIQGVCAQYPSINLSASIGISMYPQDGNTLEILYNKADTALYQAKKQGKNRFSFVGA